MADPQHILADRLRGRARGQNGPAGRLEVDRQEAGRDQSVTIKHHTGQQTVCGLWMKRRERVRRVGLEAKHLAPPSCPGGAAGMGLIRAQRTGHDTTVTETVKNRAVAMKLDSAQDVGMMPDDQIRARIDRGPCKRALIGRQPARHVYDSFMERDDANIRTGIACVSDVQGHEANRVIVGMAEVRGGSYCTTPFGSHSDVSTTGARRCGPTLLRSNTVVAEQRDAHAGGFEPRRRASQAKIHGGARMCNAILIECRQSVLDSLRAAVSDVIAGQRYRIQSYM